MNRSAACFVRIAVFGFSLVTGRAQTVLDFTDGEDKTAGVVLDGTNTPFTFQVNSGVATQSGNVSESGGSQGIRKDGAGTLVLSGSNTYSGTTSIANGTLETGTSGALGTGAVTLGAHGALHVTGGSHTIAGLSFNPDGIDPSDGAPFLVVSNGAQLTTTGNLAASFEENSPAGRIIVTGAGSKVTAGRLTGVSGIYMDTTLASGGVLELTDSGIQNFGKIDFGAAAGDAPTEAGHLIAVNGGGELRGSTLQFNHTATAAAPYWFTQDGTENGAGFSVGSNVIINSGVTDFKAGPSQFGLSLTVNGGEAHFHGSNYEFPFITLNGGLASIEAIPSTYPNYSVTFNGGTLRFDESLTIGPKVLIQGTSGTIDVAAGKTATFMPPVGEGYYGLPGGYPFNGTMAFSQGGNFVKQGAGTLFLGREYQNYVNVPFVLDHIASFTVRNGTLRVHDFAFDEVVIGEQAGDDGHFTASPTNVARFPSRAGFLTNLGFPYVNYWNPRLDVGQYLEISVGGAYTSDLAVIQSRNLMLGQQAGATGTLTLNENPGAGWYVDSGLAVVGGAGTGNVTLVDNFLYNNGGNIVIGQSAGGVGHVVVSGTQGRLNAGVDLTRFDVDNESAYYYPLYYSADYQMDHGVGNILIGQGGIGHVSITDNAQILAAHTFIGNGSDLTLGSGGTVYGDFTAQAGSTVHALSGAKFAYTLSSISAASHFQPSSAFLVDHGATLVFDFTAGADFAPGTYTLFDFAAGSSITGLGTAVFQTTGIAGYNYAFNLSGTELNVNFTAVPEPSTLALLALGLVLGGIEWRRRRSRRHA